VRAFTKWIAKKMQILEDIIFALLMCFAIFACFWLSMIAAVNVVGMLVLL
jgi:hypothetical protein